MLFLLGGVVLLAGLLLLGWLFVNANPVRLAQVAKWTGIALAAALLVALVILTEGRVFAFVLPVLPFLPALRRARSMFRTVAGGPTAQTSDAETPFIRMSLDHESGAMTGTVRQGRFTGMRLEELGRGQLIDLVRECRTADEDGARLVEAYLDRLHPDWREAMRSRSFDPPPGGSSSEMTVEEAYAILGLAPGASAAAVRAAHRRLMQQLHPDHGGSDYLATKINRARDVLLRK